MYSFNPFTSSLDKIVSYWTKDGTVLSPKSSERVNLSEIRAKDGNGLKLYEDGGSGIFVKDGGNVGINESSPDCKLHIKDGAILAEGTTGGTPASGSGTRLMWIPAKGAFRAGRVPFVPPWDMVVDQWDDANIGNGSFASGYKPKASGVASAAFGNRGEASGTYSFCTGADGKASGSYSAHYGYSGEATAASSIHFGHQGHATGSYSTHFGHTGLASGFASTHFGRGGKAEGDYTWVGGRYMQLSPAADNSFAWGYSNSPIALTQPNTFYIFPGGTAGKVAVGTATPATSAIMDLTSIIGALLLPRMTTAQRDALTPVNGMLLYNNSLNQTQTYENGAWRQI